MELVFTLSLPRDEASVPFVRHMCTSALARLGVDDECSSDIEVALSEACTNVLRHAEESKDEYEVEIRIQAGACEISVIDTGGKFDHEALSAEAVVASAESGRGVFLMRHLVDDLQFASDPANGTIVKLRKRLILKDGAPLTQLVGAQELQAAQNAEEERVEASAGPPDPG